MDSTDNNADYENHLWQRRHEILYRLRLSVLYHVVREGFFERLSKGIAAITALAATAAFASFADTWPPAKVWLALSTAALSVFALVYAPSERARKHAQLAADFRRLYVEAHTAGEVWNGEQCNHFAARTVEIESSEPLPLAALMAYCQNRLAISSGQEELQVPLTFLERHLKQWISFDPGAMSARQRKRNERLRLAALAEGRSDREVSAERALAL